MPQLRRENRTNTESCPDAEQLTAFTEDRVTSLVRESVTIHLTQCRQCSEICARLVNFDRGAAGLPQDAEWVNAEKRLGNWMYGFLRSRAGKNSKPESAQVFRAKNVPPVAFWWKLPWAMGAVAVMAVVVGGTFAAKRWIVSTTVQVATQQAPPQLPDPVMAPVAQTPEAGPGISKVPGPTPKPNKRSTKSATPAARQKSTEPVSGAAPQTAPSLAASIANDSGSSQVAQGFAPPELSPNDRIMAGKGATSSAPSAPATVARASKGLFRKMPTAATGASVAPAPVYRAAQLPPVRLEAGTRLWIRVGSINRQSDDSFTFGGTLFQPVSGASGLLNQGTELTGSGSVKDGKVTLLVRSFLIRGSPYTVQGVAATLKEQMPGAGKAVQFENGQVMEMWLSSASVYQASAEGSGAAVEAPKP